MSTNTKKTVQNILNETNQLLNQGKHKEALEILKNQISNKNNSTNPALYISIGHSYEGLGLKEESIEAFKYAFKLNPDNAFVTNKLGNVYKELNKLDEALKWFELSIASEENNFASFHGANIVSFLDHKVDKAIKYGSVVLKKKDTFYTNNFKNRFGNDISLNNKTKKKIDLFSLKNRKKRVISFSLFGENTAYWSGAIENAILINNVFNGWIGRFYCDLTIPKYVLEELLQRGAEVIIMPKHNEIFNNGTIWRFHAANDVTIDYFLVRDVDARLNSQDRVAVDEWIESGKSFHIMRDHPTHAELIMGGLWGGKAGLLPHLVTIFNQFYRGKKYGRFKDQMFLAEFVWPLIRNENLTHDEFFQFGLNSKIFSKIGRLIFPEHVGGGYKNKQFFHDYVMPLKKIDKLRDENRLFELKKYPNFRSLVPLEDIETKFSNIYVHNHWGSMESRSGTGSTIKEAEAISVWLKENLIKLGIKTIVDAACGDFNWMKHIIPVLNIKYYGFDIVEELIEKNKRLYSSKNIEFKQKNICKSTLPSCDLLIVRHCLFHLSFQDINDFLCNISLTKYQYLLTDTHIVEKSFKNRDITSGQFRLIDLYSEPLNFKKNNVLEKIHEGYDPKYPKDMLLFDKKNVPKSINYINKS
jgi:hypothetical protein